MKSIYFPAPIADEMIRAILNGRKTMARQVVDLKYSNTHLEMFTNKYGTRLIEKQNEVPGVTSRKNPNGTTTRTLLACVEKEPPYRPGEIIYVKETWDIHPILPGVFYYRADGDCRPEVWRGKWHPSVHMPKEVARIFLRVTNVRIERLRDIPLYDVWDEGTPQMPGNCDQDGAVGHEDFTYLWNIPIKKADLPRYGWAANPWVYVIEFVRISKAEALKGCNRSVQGNETI